MEMVKENYSETPTLATLVAKAKGYHSPRRVDHTRVNYQGNQVAFLSWCGEVGVSATRATPEVIAAYLVYLSDQEFLHTTIQAKFYAVRAWYRDNGITPDPTNHTAVRSTLAGLESVSGRPRRPARPLHGPDLRKILSGMWDGIVRSDPLTLRDRAFFLVAFGAALRPSQLRGLRVDDLHRRPEGYAITLRHTKSDARRPREVFVGEDYDTLTCPVAALDEWIPALGAGYSSWLFPGSNVVAFGQDAICMTTAKRMFAARLDAAGLDAGLYSLESLRTGRKVL